MASETELSDREIETLRLVATGVSNKEIALRLSISPNTVKVHLRNVFAKIGASSRTEAAWIAARMGLVELAGVRPEPEPEPEAEAELVPEEIPAPIVAVPADLSSPPAVMVETVQLHVPEPPRRVISLRIEWIVALLALFVIGAVGLSLARSATPVSTPQPSANRTPLPLVQPTTASRWIEISAMPAGRSGMAAAVYDGAIYVISGETPTGITPSGIRYRPSSGGWEFLAEKPTPVSAAQAVVLGERIFIPGGKNAQNHSVAVLEAYAPRLDQWTSLAPMPAALSGYALVACEGRMYLFGGWDGSNYSSAVYSYDPATNAWKTLSPLPSPRAFASAVLVDNKIYIIGGLDGSQALRDVWVYFPQRDQSGDHPWENRASIPEGRYAMGAASLANYIYLVGGGHFPQDSAQLPPLQYHTTSDRWITFSAPPTPVGLSPAVLALDTRLHVLGGTSTQSPQASQQTYQAIYTISVPSVQD